MHTKKIAYFSMEIALESDMKTYSGGLGVLAGDTLRAAADLNVPLVAVTLVHRKGYVQQHVDANGHQEEQEDPWDPEKHLEEVSERIEVMIEGRPVRLRAFKYAMRGAAGGVVPVFLLDADLPENDPRDRTLTSCLYGGDQRYRLAQEVVLGIGGVRLLRALGCSKLERFHMNEGHAALLGLELLDEQARASGRARFTHDDVIKVRELCVFTTHTPVPSGHDQFPLTLVRDVLGRSEMLEMHEVFCCDGVLNMTYLALNLSHYVNGVAKRHGEISQHMFGAYHIDAITNGIHVATWASEAFRALFDQHLSGWRLDNLSLRYALRIPRQAIWIAHQTAKSTLLQKVRLASGVELRDDAFTIGYARRATAYKRPLLLFRDIERLRHIARSAGPLQILYAGKAHPRDEGGKRAIADIVAAAKALAGDVSVVYLENYDVELAKLMIAGVDLWLNTPQPPLEASGTSGMKAAVNAVPTLSVLDGWWLEGHVEGVTGWSIGSRDAPGKGEPSDDAPDAEELYEKLERIILPLYYQRSDDYVDVMRSAIALTGSFFNTHRMLQQYIAHAYLE